MNNKLEKYAELVIKTGVNLADGQLLVINAPIECAEFARLLSEQAYKAGARDVVVSWNDELSAKIRFAMAPEEVFDEFPEWRKMMYVGYAREGAAFISIAASDPELMKDIAADRLTRSQKASSTALKEYRERMMSNRNPWCVVSVPTAAWAKRVFPALEPDKAVQKLWTAILTAVRVTDDNDPLADWRDHLANLKRMKDFLNEADFKYLRYRNGIGTDFTVELPEGHIWLSGDERTPDGRSFIANMPTEEVFTMPRRDGVNGVVVSAKPLNYNGNLIDNFRLVFKQGKVVEYSAERGQDILKELLATDESAAYLGEVALVPHDSPISNAGILFYNTLFDENAACHLAFGKAYPTCIKQGDSLTKEELARRGVNDSLIHEDFMIGTADLSIVGVKRDGETVTVFKDGNFAV